MNQTELFSFSWDKKIVTDSEDGYDTDLDDDVIEERDANGGRKRFFKRTDSTLVLGECFSSMFLMYFVYNLYFRIVSKTRNIAKRNIY